MFLVRIMIKDSVIKVLIVQSILQILSKQKKRKHIVRKLCLDYMYGFCRDGPECKL